MDDGGVTSEDVGRLMSTW